jgi:uncharacterized protein (TIGR03000 family)
MTRFRSLFATLFVAGTALVLTPSTSSAQIIGQIFGPQRSIIVPGTTYQGPAITGYYGSIFPGYGYNGWYYPNTRYPNIGNEGYGPPSTPPNGNSPPTNLDQRMGRYGPGQQTDRSNPSAGTSYPYGELSGEMKNRAFLNVRVPSRDAEVWIEGEKTREMGTRREFMSPVLDPEKRYSYEIKARWREDGREVTRTKTVSVRPNAPTLVDFTVPDQTPSTEKTPGK